jgi:1-phosphofructokinase
LILTVTPNATLDRTLEVRGFRAGTTRRARVVAERCAGKGINVSRCLAALGAPTAAAGLVGSSRAEAFRESVSRSGVEPAFTEIAGEVRTSTTVVDPEAEAETHIREEGLRVSADEVDRLARLVRERARDARWVVACGSLPPGFPVERHAEMLEEAREAGAKVALDSSGEGLLAARRVRLALVKPNRTELAELAGREVRSVGDAAEAARALAGAVLATLGEEGALFAGEGRAFLARCPPEEVVSSVGAGDAALAGYLWAEAGGEPPEERLRAAVAAAAASLAEPFAGALDPVRFRRLLQGARVEEL